MRSRLFILLLSSCLASGSFADTAQMNEALVNIVHQLEIIKPLIRQAELAQPKNAREQIHFDRWQDQNGVMHTGLRQDIELIQGALVQAINREAVEPRVFEPINNDFIGK